MKRKGNIESSDRRVKYTKMIIRQSFIALISEKPLAKISVTDICSRADINRGTFYAYYTDPSDLFDQIKQELLNELKAPLSSVIESVDSFDFLVKVFEALKDKKDVSTLILCNAADNEFLGFILEFVRGKFVKSWHERLPEISMPSIENVFAFTANGAIGVLRKWLKDNAVETPESMAYQIEKMTNSVLQSNLQPPAATPV